MKQIIFNGLVPMMAVFMLLTVWPTNANAKKIKYSEQIVYSGKVDSNGQPNGQGTLTTTYGEYKDILEGIFDNGVVRDAILRLKVYDKKYNHLEFHGTVGFTVTDDNKSVCYTLKDGMADCNMYNGRNRLYPSKYNLRLTSDEPLHLVMTPNALTCDVQSGSICRWFDHIVPSNVNVSDPRSPGYNEFRWLVNSYLFSEIMRLGLNDKNIKNIKSKTTLHFNNDFNLIPDENPLVKMDCDNGMTMEAHNDTIKLTYTNGDDGKYHYKDYTIYSLKKTYNDGVLRCEKPGIITFQDNKTSKKGVALVSGAGQYDKYEYAQIKADDIFKEKDRGEDKIVGQYFLENKTTCVFYGKAGEAIFKVMDKDPKGYFDLGMALYEEGNTEDAEHWINEAAEKGLPEAVSIAEELQAKVKKQKAEQIERGLLYYKRRAIQNSDQNLAFDIAYGYENGGEQSLSIFEKGQTWGKLEYYNFVENDDSAMVWYKKCVAFGGNPCKTEKNNLYKVSKRIEDLKRMIKYADNYHAKYIKKYGENSGNSLYQGNFVGLSLAAVNEYIKDMNTIEKEAKYYVKIYEPTTSDVIKYGRGVRIYRLIRESGNYAFNKTTFKVLNGKVIAQSNDYYGGMKTEKEVDLESLDTYKGWVPRLERIKK